MYLLLEDFNLSTIESRRLLYVAMTRAKQNLVIHSNSVSLDRASSVGEDWITDTEIYHPLDSVAMHLTYRDVHLDYFIGRESIVSRAVSGAPLQINSDGGLSLNGCPIIRFSRAFLNQIQVLGDKNYKLKGAKVNFVLYWYKEDENREIQIILPELHFEKVKAHE